MEREPRGIRRHAANDAERSGNPKTASPSTAGIPRADSKSAAAAAASAADRTERAASAIGT